jgi:hypothetical protein
MITAPSAEYVAYEALQTGAVRAVRASILPFFWPPGVNADGSFTHCAYLSPDRIQADFEGFTGGEWISPELAANLQVTTSPAIVTWGWNSPGYDMAVYYRGAADSAALAAASWTLLAQGDTIQLYPCYQFKVTLEGYRAWAEDALADANGFSAWAEDTAEEDAYQGYAADGPVPGDNLTYIEILVALGEYTIVRDIEKAGTVSAEVPTAFDDLAAGSHSGLLLNNRQVDSGGLPAPLYSSTHPAFLFAGEDDWYGKLLKIELGWRKLANWGTTGMWKFLGNLLDSSGEGHTLTWHSVSVFYPPAYGPGLLPGTTALTLGGAPYNTYCSLADHADFKPGAEPFTIEVIVSVADIVHTGGIFMKIGATWQGIALLHSAGKVSAWVSGPTGYRQADSHDVVFTPGEFLYIAVTWDNTDDLRIYVNKVEIAVDYTGTGVAAYNPDNTETLYIGLEPNLTQYFLGSIDLIRFHKGRALTAAEIAANYDGFLIGMPYEVGLSDAFTDFATLFLGRIKKWGPVSRALGSPNTCEVYATDLIGDCFSKRICLPAADGTPNPLTLGEFLCKAEAVSGWSPAPIVKSAYFEDGTLDELDRQAGNISVATPGLTGAHALQADTSSDNEASYGGLLLPSTSEAFITGTMRLVTVPGTIGDYNTKLIEVVNAGGTTQSRITVRNTGEIWESYSETSKFNTLAYLDVPLPFALWIKVGNPGFVRLWINGDEVASFKGDTSGVSLGECRFGVQTGAVSETWSVQFDDLEVRPTYYDNAFKVDGAPFNDIGAVYINNLAQPESQTVGAFTQTLTRFPQYGMVQFASTDPDFNLSGDVMVRVVEHAGGRHALDCLGVIILNALAEMATFTDFDAMIDAWLACTKDGTGIAAFLSAYGLTDHINAAAYAAAYVAVPDDMINIRFEGGKADKQGLKDFASLGLVAADALKEICSRMLYFVFIDAGALKVVPYTGTPPSSPVLAITGANMREVQQVIDMDSLNAFVSATYGWYGRNPSLFYVAGDTTAGGQGSGLDFTWDSPVACEIPAVVKAKVDLLLKFLSAQERLDPVRMNLAGARLELMDVVSVADDLLSDAPINYVVGRKEVDLDGKEVSLMPMRYLGET